MVDVFALCQADAIPFATTADTATNMTLGRGFVASGNGEHRHFGQRGFNQVDFRFHFLQFFQAQSADAFATRFDAFVLQIGWRGQLHTQTEKMFLNINDMFFAMFAAQVFSEQSQMRIEFV